MKTSVLRADGQDGNGFQLFIALCLGKLAKTRIMFDSLLQNSLDIFLYKPFGYNSLESKMSKSALDISPLKREIFHIMVFEGCLKRLKYRMHSPILVFSFFNKINNSN